VTTIAIDEMVEQYFGRLDAALGGIPEARRNQLLAEIKEHVELARSELPEQSEAAVQDLLDRLGRPEDIAAAALADDSIHADRRLSRKMSTSLIIGAGIVAIGIAAFVMFRTTPNPTHSATSTIPSTTVIRPPSSASTTAVPVQNPLPSGIYANGAPGTPHYYLSLTGASNGSVTGSVSFLYQDGQSSVVITFDGTSQNGTALLHPTSVPQNGSASQNPATVPAAISANYGQESITLGECPSYLHFVQSMTQCTFASSAGP
jgi:hypothetical protein